MKYECDQCGACCKGSLIVHADQIDVLREPRLIDADPHCAGKSADTVLAELQDDIGKALIIACGMDRPCQFLDGDTLLSVNDRSEGSARLGYHVRTR